MCGIWCSICSDTSHSSGSPPVEKPLLDCPLCVPNINYDTYPATCNQKEFISRRGPDSANIHCVPLPNACRLGQDPSQNPSGTNFQRIHLESHVLWTQGEKVYQQPYHNDDQNKFMIYNGDIYSFEGFGGNNGESLYPHNNDGNTLFKLFEKCSENADEMCKIIGNLQGPFAFVFANLAKKELWFGRDFFGRESLLFSYEKPGVWNISSVSVYPHVFEVPTSGIYCLNFETRNLKIHQYSHLRQNVTDLETNFITALQTSSFVSNVSLNQSACISLHFSSLLKQPELPVQCSKFSSLIDEAKRNNISAEDFLRNSLKHISEDVQEFLACLRKSILRRVSVLPPFCKDCVKLVSSNNADLVCNHAKVGVLFSGGLDSTVLAYLAAEALPKGSTLDLINVAFSKTSDFNNIPDRETALASYKMLEETFRPQEKNINLVLANITKPEVEEKRKERIKYLISPLKSVLDDSVGVCLWFAARGRGCLFRNGGQALESLSQDYMSPIRVVLLGSGADELLGGYGRHRSSYEKYGWIGLASEMQLEIDRISIRNLGRDNRIVSDHGLCPRMPFLDENVVDFLTRCDLWVKCCPVNVGPLGSRGSGEKFLLRALGATLFGDAYLSLALFPKRAMQFGSRIAKLENSKEKGGDSCQRLY